MSRKLLILLVVVAFSASGASMAMAWSLGAFGHHPAVLGNGSTAGTILNPEGKGDALIFPYYDVRTINGKTQDNYFAIINDSMTNGIDDPVGGIAAKLRFREWDKSLEVYDINIWLSCYDVWVGLIQQGPNSLAYLWSPDWVITDAPSSGTTFTLQTALNVTSGSTLVGRPFRPQLIPIANDRTLYGYFEVIAEERTACKILGSSGSGSSKIGAVSRTHADAPNYLEGYAYLVRVTDGVAVGYNATAFANFARNLGSLYYPPESDQPNFKDCEDTIDQIEFMLAKRFLTQGYSIESNIAAKFSAIITFPTKHYHFGAIDVGFPLNDNAHTYTISNPAPRGEPFAGKSANSGEVIYVAIWDRLENLYFVPPGFESPTQEGDEIKLKYEVNVVGLYNANPVVVTNPRDNMGLPTGGFDSGWFKIDLNGTKSGFGGGPHSKTLPDGNLKLGYFNWFGNFFETYYGLPAIGLVIQEFSNSNAGGSYGEILPIFYEVDWEGLQNEP